MARCFSDKLAAIGVALRWMDGRVFAGTLPAILTERLVCGQSTVASVVQVRTNSHHHLLLFNCMYVSYSTATGAVSFAGITKYSISSFKLKDVLYLYVVFPD